MPAPSPFGRFIDPSKSIGECFRNVAQRFASRTAVHETGRAYSYAELGTLSDHVAVRVQQACPGDGGRIGLLLQHGLPAIAGLLGALKAGKAYVPVDPRHPTERIRRIAADADLQGWVTDARHADQLREVVGAPHDNTVVMPQDWVSGASPARLAGGGTTPASSAYLIYTSGSTGAPKGVVQTHGHVLQYLKRFASALSIGPEDTYLHIASYAFEAGVKSILAPLLSGAAVCVADREKLGGPAFEAWLRDAGVTIWHSVPTMYRHFLRTASGSTVMETVRAVILSGEELLPSDLDAHADSPLRRGQVMNLYGLTEASLHLLWKVDPEDRDPVRLGYPFSENEVRIVTPSGEPVGPDEIGEIVIESGLLANGYWRDAEATRQRFEQTPEGLARFRTGDLGRWLADGGVQLCGRRGTQLKIRGFRVEPGDVENALLETGLVRQAVVSAREGIRGQPRLVAHCAPAGNVAVEADVLRSRLSMKLPDYMIPVQFIALDELPITLSGKVDRDALPQVRWQERSAPYEAPRNPVEEALCSLWAGILQLDRAGINDHFFELGGDSLLAVQLVARIREVLGMETEISALFENATVAALAPLLRLPQEQSDSGAGKRKEGFETIEF